MSRVLAAADYKTIRTADNWIAPLVAGTSAPANMTVTTSAAAAANATTIAVTALTAKLYDGHRLKFGSVTAKLTATANIGATSLAVEPLSGSVASGATASTYVLLPLYSIRQFNPQFGEKMVEFRNFNSAEWEQNLILARSWQVSCQGFFTLSDPGLDLLKATNKKVGNEALLYVEYIDSDGDGDKGFANLMGYQETREMDNVVSVQWTFKGSGKFYDIDDTIS